MTIKHILKTFAFTTLGCVVLLSGLVVYAKVSPPPDYVLCYPPDLDSYLKCPHPYGIADLKSQSQ